MTAGRRHSEATRAAKLWSSQSPTPRPGIIEHVTVGADLTTTRTFSGFADGTYTVVIMVGATDFSQTFTVDCDHPSSVGLGRRGV